MTPALTISPDPLHWQLLQGAKILQDGAAGLRFQVQHGASSLPAFAVKHQGQLVAYLNQCAHVAMEMDWLAGQFFDSEQRYIMCATHGARYEPATGVCVSGPCVGAQLKPVALRYNPDDEQYYAPRHDAP